MQYKGTKKRKEKKKKNLNDNEQEIKLQDAYLKLKREQLKI